jgi:hypothetical protein
MLGVLVLIARFGFGIELPAAAESPFQILLVALVAVMLLQREQSARFIAFARILANWAVAARLQSSGGRAQLLRGEPGHRDYGRSVSLALPRHYAARRRAHRRYRSGCHT